MGRSRSVSSRADALQHLEAGDVRQAQVEHDAVEGLRAQRGQRLLARARGHDLEIVVPQQLLDAHLLGRVVLDDQQALLRRRGVVAQPAQRRAEVVSW
jgi:hypothetical protein